VIAMIDGKNLTYGGSAPNYSGSVVLDLKRMNRIIEADDVRNFAIVDAAIARANARARAAARLRSPCRHKSASAYDRPADPCSVRAIARSVENRGESSGWSGYGA
jgi:FAD/FMN-containing dehydrogenase